MQTTNEKIIATLCTYHSPAGKSFPVIRLYDEDGNAFFLAIGNMNLKLDASRVKFGAAI